jgi:hypothetical protein
LSPLDKLRFRRAEATAPEPGMVRAEDLSRTRRAAAGDGSPETAGASYADPALVTRRERLAERLTLMQLELGGAFYEMAIRDHVQMDALLARAAELQEVDAELAHVDELLTSGRQSPGGVCSKCQSPHARGAAYCWNCGASLAPADAGSARTTELDAVDEADAPEA